jgi:hypothetical protein
MLETIIAIAGDGLGRLGSALFKLAHYRDLHSHDPVVVQLANRDTLRIHRGGDLTRPPQPVAGAVGPPPALRRFAEG